MMRSYLIFLGCVASIQYVLALQCYTCTSKSPQDPCFTPMKAATALSKTCNQTSMNLTNFFNLEHVNPFYLNETKNASEFQCVSYKKTYLPQNVTQVGRGCFPKTPSLNVCEALYLVHGDGQAFRLAQCNVCDRDNCNSSPTLYPYGLLYLVPLAVHCILAL